MAARGEAKGVVQIATEPEAGHPLNLTCLPFTHHAREGVVGVCLVELRTIGPGLRCERGLRLADRMVLRQIQHFGDSIRRLTNV